LPHTQALDSTLASEAGARRDVAQALATREERAARAYVEKLEREAARLAELAGKQQRLKESQIQ
jgi:plasmid stabilization system protein ParE